MHLQSRRTPIAIVSSHNGRLLSSFSQAWIYAQQRGKDMIATEAWVLYKGPGARNEQQEPGELRREIYFFPDIQETEVLTEPIYGGWEANLSHAISRKPIDICQQRD